MIAVPSVIVFITSASSYFIYKKSSMKLSVSLEVRMLLLPVIMTVIGSVYLLAQDTINWVNVTTTDERVPGVTVYVVFHMMWDSNSAIFGLIIIFFIVSLRKKCWSYLMAFKQYVLKLPHQCLTAIKAYLT